MKDGLGNVDCLPHRVDLKSVCYNCLVDRGQILCGFELSRMFLHLAQTKGLCR